MKELLFVSIIDWNWIKQRPQFLAEELSKQFHVTYACNKARFHKLKNNDINGNIEVRKINQIPLIDRYSFARGINDFLYKDFYKRLINEKNPDAIYLNDPTRIRLLENYYEGPIIYDCMDDHLSFQINGFQRDLTFECERRAIEKSAFTIATSENLRDKLLRRYGKACAEKIHLIRNGFTHWNIDEIKNSKAEDKGKYKFCYFGTIAEWFNFEFILRSLSDYPNIEYLLIGPVDRHVTIPEHERIVHVPSVPHQELPSITADSNAFIMPFVLNDLILSVDPVKLYEYISLGKDVLSIKYPEIERFSPFIYCYNTYDEYRKQIGNMMDSNERKYTEELANKFLLSNDWISRAENIVRLMKNYGIG